MKRKIFFIIVLLVIFGFSISPVFASTSVDFMVSGGADVSDGTVSTFTASDITKLGASDDIRIQSNATSWPNTGVGTYDENKYIEFLFSPNVPDSATIESVSISNEFRRSAAMTATKLEVWDGSSFTDEILTTGTSNVDHTDVIDLSSFINNPSKVNNIKARFLAYRDSEANTTTSHDFIKVSVTYNISTSDTTSPNITLTGLSPVNLNVGGTYTELGATATDNVDASVTVLTSGSVDTTTAGTYTIHYNATDVSGNKATEVTRTVIVSTSSGGNGGSGGGGILPVKTFSTSNALDFLSQNKDIASIPVHDWVAIAAGAGNDANLKSNLITYIRSNPVNSSTVTENDRRAMALMSLGINPYNGTEINYIQKILDSFNGTQFYDESGSDFNDDIFALIVLKNAGYNGSDEKIAKDIDYIISKQSSNGSWGSVDMTGAGIQALRGFENISLVSEAISKGESYLISNQKSDGSFENTSSTSWALQSLFTNSNILKAESYLATKQQTDGGLENIGDDINTRIWSTSYAIPAILHKPWKDIMQSFQKPVTQNNSSASVLENTDFQKPDDHVFCSKGDLFSTITGESCTNVIETNVVDVNIPTLAQDKNLIKKVVNKKNIETPKIKKVINPAEIQNSLNQDQEISVENNLGASAGNATSIKISFKKIPQTVIRVVVNTLAYIGKGFYDLIIFLGSSIGAVFG